MELILGKRAPTFNLAPEKSGCIHSGFGSQDPVLRSNSGRRGPCRQSGLHPKGDMFFIHFVHKDHLRTGRGFRLPNPSL